MTALLTSTSGDCLLCSKKVLIVLQIPHQGILRTASFKINSSQHLQLLIKTIFCFKYSLEWYFSLLWQYHFHRGHTWERKLLSVIWTVRGALLLLLYMYIFPSLSKEILILRNTSSRNIMMAIFKIKILC